MGGNEAAHTACMPQRLNAFLWMYGEKATCLESAWLLTASLGGEADQLSIWFRNYKRSLLIVEGALLPATMWGILISACKSCECRAELPVGLGYGQPTDRLLMNSRPRP